MKRYMIIIPKSEGCVVLDWVLADLDEGCKA